MDVSSAGALSLYAYKSGLQDAAPAQALQQAIAQASLLASGGTAPLTGQVGPADPFTNLLRQAGEAPVPAASYTISVQSGNGASEIQNLLASAQPSASLSGLLSTGGLSSLASFDSRTAGALATYQLRNAPNAADAYAQVQALAAGANQALNGVALSLMA